MNIHITRHGSIRLQERLDLPQNDWLDHLKTVINEGTHLNSFEENGRVQRWAEQTKQNVYRYEGHVYLFDKDDESFTLITVMPQKAVADQIINYEAKQVRNSTSLDNPKDKDIELEGWEI